MQTADAKTGREWAEELGYRVRGFAPEGDQQSWSVWAETERVPSLANVQRMRRVMEISAGRHGGSCLRNWLAPADADEGRRGALATDERKEIALLRKEKRRLEMGNEILRQAGRPIELFVHK